MPPKPVDKPSSSSEERGIEKHRREAEHAEPEPAQHRQPTIMTTRTQTSGYPVALHDGPGRLRLTPILPVPEAMISRGTPSSASPSPYAPNQGLPWSPGPYTQPGSRTQPAYFPSQYGTQPASSRPISPPLTYPAVRAAHHETSIPQKRPYEPQESPHGFLPQPSIRTPTSIAPQNTHASNVLRPRSERSSTSNASTPTSTTASFPLLGQASAYSRPTSEISSNAITNRCSLHIRQQPRAARAGPDGKDRRNIDPPPVLQLLLTDFDPGSSTDLSELKSNHYVVHCKLISADSPRRDVTTQTTVSEDGSRETSRLLLGTNVASPFFCADDPDIAHMPQHPKSSEAIPEAPPSPSDIIFRRRRTSTSPTRSGSSEGGLSSNPQNSTTTTTPASSSLPGAFFIFADLSVRRAGSYRLEFTLMKIDPSAMNLPMIYICASQVFRVVNAKDFDQVHPSTHLVKGLLERGAPFPLKLKKGIREGQKRRTMGMGEEGGSVEGSNEGERGGGADEDEDEDAED